MDTSPVWGSRVTLSVAEAQGLRKREEAGLLTLDSRTHSKRSARPIRDRREERKAASKSTAIVVMMRPTVPVSVRNGNDHNT